jgi:CHAT domain-containing protein/tetratricopeptide (TPR) repeat protein
VHRLAIATLPLLAAVLLLRQSPIPPEEQYRQALVLFRDGEFVNAAAMARTGWPTRRPSEWYWRFRLLQADALIESGKPGPGLALLDIRSSVTSPEFEIRRRVLTARRLVRLNDFERANALLDEARQLAQRHLRPDLEPERYLLLAQILAAQKQFAPAETALDSARRSAQAAGDLFRVASSVNNIGMLRMLQSRWDEAIPFFEQARQLWRSAGAGHSADAAAGNNLRICYSRLGDFDKALAYWREIQPQMRPGTLLANALGETGTAYLYQEEPHQAIPYYRKACDMARQFGSPRDAARWAGNLTGALAAIGDWNAAEQALQEATRLGPEPRSRVFLDLDAAAIAQGRKRFEEAREIYQRAIASNPVDATVKWEAYAGIANTWAASGDAGNAGRNFETAIRIIEEHQSEIGGNENKISFLARLIRFYDDYVDALMTQNQTVKALAVADSSRARVLSQRIDRRLEGATPRQAAEFSAIARQSGSVWLSYWLAPRRSFLWVATPTEVRVFILRPLDEIAKLVAEYRGFVETSLRDPLQVQSEAGRRLYDILIAPAAPMLPPGTRVIVVPDGPLHQLSFETLPVYTNGANGAKPHYWMEDAITAIAPSFGVFRGDHRRTGPPGKALIIGDPLSPGPSFPVLPHAAEEIAAIRKRLSAPGSRVVTREAARREVWTQINPGDYDIIHIAAHAEANPRSPLDSAIILSPGSNFRLYARDIIDVPLHADLVTLSACRSSGARTYAGEGLVGLAWAFLQAGSRTVVAGLWDVSDASTAVLMDRFYAGIAAGISPAEALNNARLDLRRGPYSKPYYWGPFQCYLR